MTRFTEDRYIALNEAGPQVALNKAWASSKSDGL
jgi:hypothetical protein